MPTVYHRFKDYPISPETEILILGTFNPETIQNKAKFFYGRSKNFLWRLLPVAFGENDLKGSTVEDKQNFIRKYKIDFLDLVLAADIEDSRLAKYDDKYLDKHVSSWNNVTSKINTLKSLKVVFFTRKTFADIPRMREKIYDISEHCNKKTINFQPICSPARYYSQNKQSKYSRAFEPYVRKDQI